MARSLKVASQHIQQVKQALRRNGYARQTDLAQELGLALSTISNFLNGRAVDTLNFYEICRKLALDSQKVADLANQAQDKTIIEESEADFSNYIERPPIEDKCYEIIEQPGSMLLIKAPKGMGKSFLIERIIDYAKQLNYRTVNLDLILLQDYKSDLSDLKENFLYRFCSAVTEELGLPDKLRDRDNWKESLSNRTNCHFYFQKHLLPQLDEPFVLCLNNVDHIFEHIEIAIDFFTILRAWYEKAQTVKLWKKLRLVLGYSTEVDINIPINQSPFNVGIPIELPEFTLEQVQELVKRQDLNWNSSQVKQIMDMIGGHPYLLRLAIDEVKYQNLTLEKLLEDASTDAGIYHNHLQQLLEILERNKDLSTAMKTVIEGSTAVTLDSRVLSKLKNLGLVHLEENHVKPSNKLYRLYFQTHL